jgi:hypothetical protein
MMLFIGRRLKAPLFQGELAGRALGVVLSEQQLDGSWLALTDDSARPSVFSTAAAVHALALWQPDGWHQRAERAVEWLWSWQRLDGSWDENGFHECYLTVLVLDAIDLASSKSPLTFSPRDIGKHSDVIWPAVVGADAADGSQGGVDAPPLDKAGVKVLCYLSERSPALCTVDDVENDVEVSRAIATNTITSLIRDGYACRPKGERSGATVTEKGRAIAALLMR